MHKRTWLLPLFGVISSILVWTQYEIHDISMWYIGPSPLTFLGFCFLGLFAWDLVDAVRRVSHFLPPFVLVLAATMTVVYCLIFPIDPFYIEWVPDRVPLFALILFDLIVLWNVGLREVYYTDIRPWVRLRYSMLLVVIFAILGTYFSDYGQMVSFFFLMIPVVLAWEEIIDESTYLQQRRPPERRHRLASRLVAALAISFIAGFMGIYFANMFWVT